MACSMGVGCGGYFTPALREYLPYRNLRAAAPFGTQSYLPKECIQFGCPPQRMILYYIEKIKACDLTPAQRSLIVFFVVSILYYNFVVPGV